MICTSIATVFSIGQEQETTLPEKWSGEVARPFSSLSLVSVCHCMPLAKSTLLPSEVMDSKKDNTPELLLTVQEELSGTSMVLDVKFLLCTIFSWVSLLSVKTSYLCLF